MTPVTFEKGKFEKDFKENGKRKEGQTSKKMPQIKRPTFNSFPTEQGPIRDEVAKEVSSETKTVAQTLNDTFEKPQFSWKNATISAVTAFGVLAGMGALVMGRRKRKAIPSKKMEAGVQPKKKTKARVSARA